ncbi:MAG: methyltransferase domain-containing protein [Acidobacteriota bacterium]
MSDLPKRLNLGCGRRKIPEAWNVDRVASVAPDLVWDLDRPPYPLPAGHFERIYAFDVVEHLGDLVAFVEEAHRLLAPGGVLEITTPHFSCANSFTDPTHRHHLGYFSFDYFTDRSGWNFYSEARFEIVSRLMVFPSGRLIGRFSRWANRHPEAYERRFAWIVPAWFLVFELAKMESSASPA